MADRDDGERANFTDLMPAPPPFWKQFSDQNVQRVKELQEREEQVPESLRALVPPPPPADGKYRSFGDDMNVRAPTMEPRLALTG